MWAGILFTVLVLLILFFLWVAAYDGNRFEVTTYRIETDKVSREHTLVFLTDLHNHAYGEDNERLLDAINTIGPEAILVGGDVINAGKRRFSKKPTDFGHSVKLLKALAARYPLYFAEGNHEQRSRVREDYYRGLYSAFAKELGISHNSDKGAEEQDQKIAYLLNDTLRTEDGEIAITGFSMDLEYYKKFRERRFREGYMKEVLGEREKTAFSILLAHNPEYFEEYAAWDPDLVLSGHVHGGVVRLPFLGGVIAPSLRIFPHYDAGLFEEFGHKMILGRGLGMHTIPIRVFNPGELIRLELVPAGGFSAEKEPAPESASEN